MTLSSGGRAARGELGDEDWRNFIRYPGMRKLRAKLNQSVARTTNKMCQNREVVSLCGLPYGSVLAGPGEALPPGQGAAHCEGPGQVNLTR